MKAHEDWKRSSLLQILRSKTGTRKRGLRRWLTHSDMVKKWGKEVADDIREVKLNDPIKFEKETRQHPELPNREVP